MAKSKTFSMDSEDELPDIAVLLGGLAISRKQNRSAHLLKAPVDRKEPEPPLRPFPRPQNPSTKAKSLTRTPWKNGGKTSNESKQSMKSDTAYGFSITDELPRLTNNSERNIDDSDSKLDTSQTMLVRQKETTAIAALQDPACPGIRRSPTRKAKQNTRSYHFGLGLDHYVCVRDSEGDGDESFTDHSSFIVDDDVELGYDDSDFEDGRVPTRSCALPFEHVASTKSSKRLRKSRKKPLSRSAPEETLSNTDTAGNESKALRSLSLNTNPNVSGADLGKNEKPRQNRHHKSEKKFAFTQSTEDSRNDRFSSGSPSNVNYRPRCRTPPPFSSTESRLNSPSKKPTREVPCSPHRSSIDAFWSSEIINDWNEQYSPRKTPGRGRGIARFLIQSDEDSPSERHLAPSPRKSRKSKAPAPGGKMEAISEQAVKKANKEKKKAWNAQKTRMAYDLILDLDKSLFNLQLTTSLAHLGGVEVKWSKTLTKTSGRANRVVDGNGTVVSAYIELAEKVVDRPERLVQTLAHEFCHMGVYFLHGHGVQAHGKEFWELANKVAKLFSNHPNPLYRDRVITTRHTYEIEYKYQWICTGAKVFHEVRENSQGCGSRYGRHTKSIDVTKRRCGRCLGVLLQIEPPVKKSELLKIGYFAPATKENVAPVSTLHMPPDPFRIPPMAEIPASPYDSECGTIGLATMTAMTAAEHSYPELTGFETMTIDDLWGEDDELDWQLIEVSSGFVQEKH